MFFVQFRDLIKIDDIIKSRVNLGDQYQQIILSYYSASLV